MFAAEEDLDYYAKRVDRITEGVRREMDYYLHSPYAAVPGITEYIAYLANRIGEDGLDPGAIRRRDGWGEQREIKFLEPSDYAQMVLTMALNKPFNKLNVHHKTMLLEKYAESLEYPTHRNSDPASEKKRQAANRKEIANALLEGLNKKRYNSGGTQIEYDGGAGIIRDIPSVYLEEVKKKSKEGPLYIIDWSRKKSS